MTWIQTLSGSRFDLLQPEFGQVSIEEIAVCLSRTCRFCGHVREFYSVAQHSVHVCRLVNDPLLKLPALLHDAHEAYSGFGDVLAPAFELNRKVTWFIRFHQRKIDKVIAEHFGFDIRLFYEPEVRQADLVALATEKRDLMEKPPANWIPLPEPDPEKIEPLDEHGSRVLFTLEFNKAVAALRGKFKATA